MSRAEKATIAIGVLGIILMGYQAWDILDRRRNVTAAIAVSVWIIAAGMIGYSIYSNLKDAHRADTLRSEIITIKDEHTTQMKGQEKQHEQKADGLRRANATLVRQISSHQDEIDEIIARHQRDMERLKSENQKAVADSRRLVIHSATWGIGGMYSQEYTGNLNLYVARGKNLQVSEEFFGPAGHPGEQKVLQVKFSCPCSAKVRECFFREGQLLDFEELCEKKPLER